MTAFQPNALSLNTLKQWVKTLRKRAPAILGQPVTQATAQELVAQTLGHPNWHQAVATLKASTPSPESSDRPTSNRSFEPDGRRRWRKTDYDYTTLFQAIGAAVTMTDAKTVSISVDAFENAMIQATSEEVSIAPTPSAPILFLHALAFLLKQDMKLDDALAVLEKPLPQAISWPSWTAEVQAVFATMAQQAQAVRQYATERSVSLTASLMAWIADTPNGPRVVDVVARLGDLDLLSSAHRLLVLLLGAAGPLERGQDVPEDGVRSHAIRRQLLKRLATSMDHGSSWDLALQEQAKRIQRDNRYGQFSSWGKAVSFLEVLSTDLRNLPPCVAIAQTLAPCSRDLAVGLLVAHQAGLDGRGIMTWEEGNALNKVAGPDWMGRMATHQPMMD
jgi:hypothetical protein